MRLQPIRTASEVPVKIILQPLERIPLYQKLVKKVEELLLLEISFRAIGRIIDVNKITVMRTYKYINERYVV
jgi:transposase-like protein